MMTTREQSPKLSLEKKYSNHQEKSTNLMNMIEKKEVVGRGGFGKVWRVELRGSNGKYLALKEMSKALYLVNKVGW